MKIGLNARFLSEPYTGIGQYTWNLLMAMAKQDKSAKWVLVMPKSLKIKDPNLKIPENTEILIIPEKKLPTASLRKAFWEQFQAPRALKKAKVDLIHYPYPANPRFHKLGYGLFHLKCPKSVVTIHDIIPWENPDYRKKLRTRLYQKNAQKALLNATQIIAVSQTTALEFTDFIDYPFHHVQIIHEAAAPVFSRRTRKYGYGKPYLIYVGGYDPRKNVTRLIEAFKEYIAPKFDIDLILVGAKDAMKVLKKDPSRLLKSLPLGKIKNLRGQQRGKIILMPYLPPQKLAQYYRGSLGFVNVSLAEGFNLPLLEAAGSEVPILTSDIPIHREIVGQNGCFCDPKSTKSIGEMLLNFLRDSNLQDKLKASSRTLTKQYSWEKAARETLDLYHKLL